MYFRILIPALFLCHLLFNGAMAFAEFLPTGSHTFQDSSLKVSVVRVPQSEEFPGIFVLRHTETQLQLFDPEKLREDGRTVSIFLEWSPQML